MAGGVAEQRVRIETLLDAAGAREAMVADVREGLARPLKELKPKYFYDERGSELFDRITELPEYYPNRAERAILNRHAPELIALTQGRELVELGSGTASKTRALLYAMAGAGTLRRYVPFDVDPSVVERCADELSTLYPGLEVHGVVGDFERHLGELPDGDGRLVAFLGGTIGNLYPAERARMLATIAEALGPDDRFLLGVDLLKDAAILEAAYNDSQGLTAEFNRNALRVLNAQLDGDFRVEAFDHRAFFDPERSWVEMRLRARGEQRVRLRGAGLEVRFADAEEVRTEVSTKFTLEQVADELAAAGMRSERFFADPAGYFALSLAAPG